MDMIYGLPFRDWMEIDRSGKAESRSIARNESDDEVSSGDGNGGRMEKRFRG
jgi:hypothetical protein